MVITSELFLFVHVLCVAGINNSDGITFDGVGEIPFALMSHVEA